MFAHYLSVLFRNLGKRPVLTFVNIFGLSIGISICLLCYLHIKNELSYDKHFSGHENIYRLVNGNVAAGEGWVKVSTPIPEYLQSNVPGIKEYMRLTRASYNPKITIAHDNQVFNEANVYLADPSIVEFFAMNRVGGPSKESLQNKKSILISESSKKKLFGNESAIGETLVVGGEHLFQITAIFKDLPAATHVDIDYIINFSNLEKMLPGTSLTGNWTQFNYFGYVRLDPSVRAKEVEDKIAQSIVKMDGGNTLELKDVHLQALAAIHFQDNPGNSKAAYDTKYLTIYAAVAIAVLLISLINFVNLSIAASTKRIKEVGVRKVVGASRFQLIKQHITETTFVVVLATIVAVVLIQVVLLPLLNTNLERSIQFNFWQLTDLMTIAGTVLLVSLIGGAYIAFFVTGFVPSKALKGTFKNSGGGTKNILLGLQFTISLLLILSSIFIYNQMNYMFYKDLGMNPNQVLNISLYNGSAQKNAGVLKRRLEVLNGVEGVSTTRFNAGAANWNQTVWWEGQMENNNMALIMADESFVKVMEMQLIEGESKVVEQPLKDGEYRYVLNKAAREYVGWDSALGKSIHCFGQKSKALVAGVVEDFNFKSLHHSVDPVVVVMHKNIQPGQIMVKINSKQILKTTQSIKEVFEATIPGVPFEYHFLDQQFDQLYTTEKRTSQILASLTATAILLALLGVYGLVVFAIQERTKEISIRKVLGLSVPGVMALLSQNYIRILMVSNVIAIPMAWYVVDIWLSNFSYRVSLSPVVFVVGSGLIWFFVLGTVFLNAVQVNKLSTVEGLRND